MADPHEPPIPTTELVSVLKNLRDELSSVSDMLTDFRSEDWRISGAAASRTVLLEVDLKMAGYASMIKEAHGLASHAYETMVDQVEPLQQEVSDLRSRFEALEEEDVEYSERPDLIRRLRWDEKQLDLLNADSSKLAALLKKAERETEQAGVRASGLRMQRRAFKVKKEEADKLNSDLQTQLVVFEVERDEAVRLASDLLKVSLSSSTVDDYLQSIFYYFSTTRSIFQNSAL